MEIKDLKDFYIDLNGDIKATIGNKEAKFITTNDKLDSEYVIANDISEIKYLLDQLNPDFELNFEIFKQYSIKRDQHNEITGVKLYADNSDVKNGLNMILTGYDITSDAVFKDYYFIGDLVLVNEFIKTNELIYEVKEFETHKHFLYAVKYDLNNKIVNFKTYYVNNESLVYHSTEMIPYMKKVLKFI